MDSAQITARQISEQITDSARLLVGYLASKKTADEWCLPHADRYIWEGGGIRMAIYGSNERSYSKEGQAVGMGARAYEGFTLQGRRLLDGYGKPGRELSDAEIAELFLGYDDQEQAGRWAQYADAMGLLPVKSNTDPLMISFDGTPDQFAAKYL